MYVDYTTPFQINYAPNLIDFMELIIMVTYNLSPDSRVQQVCSSPEHCIWTSAREVFGQDILVLLNPAGYMLTSSGFAFIHLRYTLV